MSADLVPLMQEATGLGLFKPQGAFEVHCNHCQARLDTRGDCASCGLIGRPAAELDRRAQTDPDGVAKLLRGAIERRKAFKPLTKERAQPS